MGYEKKSPIDDDGLTVAGIQVPEDIQHHHCKSGSIQTVIPTPRLSDIELCIKSHGYTDNH